MSELKDQLRSDLTDSIKAKDKMKSSTLRMVLSSISNAEVAGMESKELSDEDVLSVLTKEAKKRREAADAFTEAGRTESAEQEQAEAAIISAYLPEQMNLEEIAVLVSSTIDELGVAGEGMKAMGRVMGVLNPKVKGRADGGMVAAEVKKQLG